MLSVCACVVYTLSHYVTKAAPGQPPENPRGASPATATTERC